MEHVKIFNDKLEILSKQMSTLLLSQDKEWNKAFDSGATDKEQFALREKHVRERQAIHTQIDETKRLREAYIKQQRADNPVVMETRSEETQEEKRDRLRKELNNLFEKNKNMGLER